MMRHNTAKWLGLLLGFVVLAAGLGVWRQRSIERQAEEACVVESEEFVEVENELEEEESEALQTTAEQGLTQ